MIAYLRSFNFSMIWILPANFVLMWYAGEIFSYVPKYLGFQVEQPVPTLFTYIEIGVLASASTLVWHNYELFNLALNDIVPDWRQRPGHLLTIHPFVACIFLLLSAILVRYELATMYVWTIAAVYYTYCRSNLRYYEILRNPQVTADKPRKALSLYASNLFIFRDENTIAMFAYCVIIAVAFIMVARYAIYQDEARIVVDDLKSYAAGAATLHLTVSAVRFGQIVVSGHHSNHNLEIIDFLSTNVHSASATLQHLRDQSSDFFRNRFRVVQLSFFSFFVIAVITTTIYVWVPR